MNKNSSAAARSWNERQIIAKNSLRILDCEDCTFTGLQITNVKDTAAVQVENSRRLNISGCNINDVENIGLSLKNVSDSIVSNCIIGNPSDKGGFTPIVEVDCERNLVTNNLV